MDVTDAVFAVVRMVPSGKVATYGQVADGVEGVYVNARTVGGIMALSPPSVPWWRIVGSGGTLPIAKRDPAMAAEQRRRLENEGVPFLTNGSIDMSRCQWKAGAVGSLFDET